MSVSSITEWGWAGVTPLTSSATRSVAPKSSATTVEPVAPASPAPSLGTSPLSQPFTRDMQVSLLQLQSTNLGMAQSMTGAGTGRVTAADPDGDSDGAAESSAAQERPSQETPSGFLETGSPAAPGSLAAAGGPLGTGPGTTWTASSTYTAALQAYVQKSPTLPAMLQATA